MSINLAKAIVSEVTQSPVECLTEYYIDAQIATNDEIYNEMLSTYLERAEKYGNDHKDEIKENTDGTVVTIDDLIKENYIGAASSNGEIIDIRDNVTKMNNIKIQLIYDEESGCQLAAQRTECRANWE